jgi:NAD(P) transhydrogenase subunit alpha
VRIAVLKETQPGERRVAQVPETAAKLVKAGHEVIVEHDAGLAAGFDDEAYKEAGCTIVGTGGHAVALSQVVLGVRAPAPAALAKAQPGTLLISFLPSVMWPALAKAKIDCIAMERGHAAFRGCFAEPAAARGPQHLHDGRGARGVRHAHC